MYVGHGNAVLMSLNGMIRITGFMSQTARPVNGSQRSYYMFSSSIQEHIKKPVVGQVFYAFLISKEIASIVLSMTLLQLFVL